jgi:hypothetical protein
MSSAPAGHVQARLNAQTSATKQWTLLLIIILHQKYDLCLFELCCAAHDAAVSCDNVAEMYPEDNVTWRTATPVILPIPPQTQNHL